jgi:anti-sigma B factor antagonist
MTAQVVMAHWMEREQAADVTVLRLTTARLPDDDTVRAVFDPLSRLVGEGGRKHLVLNLAVAEHLPSMALAKLVTLSRMVRASNGRLALCHLCPTVEARLASTHLGGLFDIYATEEEAVQSFG